VQHGGGGWSANVFFACGWIEIVVLKKQHYDCRVDCKKCDKKKTTAGLIARRQAKRLCKPRFDKLSELEKRGEDFCMPVILLCGAARNLLTGKA
jgi:hypothetical protein